MVQPLGERVKKILLKKKLIAPEKLEEVLKQQARTQVRLSEILIKEGLVKEENLISVIGEEFGLSVINLKRFHPDPELKNIINQNISRRYHIFPVSKIGQTLTVAMSDPLNVLALDTIKILTGYNLKLVLTTESALEEAIQQFYTQVSEVAAVDDILKEVTDESLEVISPEEEESVTDLQRKSEGVPVVKFVNLLLSKALKMRASDIHIEPYEQKLRVRYRVDGVLQEIASPPKKSQAAIIARIKIMSGMDIAEKRVPQDGRFQAVIAGKSIDYRVSCLPIARGEKVVIRALDKTSLSIGLNELGFSEASRKRFEMAVQSPYGMILITGPTGSGKSTTLYCILNKLNTPERNIVTIEDPVEYEVHGITQLPIKPEIGLTFACGLRSILRQSPDIIMIGEIRDRETADIAIKASLTGELVLSTLHTNDAPGAITRLIDMGVEPFLIASSLIIVAAQRLVRKLCKSCCVKVPVTEELKKRFKLKTDSIYRASGCAYCNQTGYLGRTAIIELLQVSEPIKELILTKADADRIRAVALKEGMRTLREDGLLKVEEGITSLEEVLRVS